MEKKYFYDINILRGFAIVLVVLGHAMGSFNQACFEVNYFSYLIRIIYSFHMPLFIFISGFFGNKVFECISISEKVIFVKKKFTKLLIPYFFISIVGILIKVFFNRFAVNKINTSSILSTIFFFPTKNPIPFLWFLHTLFIIFLIVIILNRFNKTYFLYIFFVLSFVTTWNIQFLNITGISFLLFYFYFGLIFREYYDYLSTFKYKKIICIFCFLLIIMGNEFSYSSFLINRLIKVSLPFCSIFGFLFLSTFIEKYKNNIIARGLTTAGKYSFEIYLWSWFYQIAFRVLICQYLNLGPILSLIGLSISGFMPVLVINIKNKLKLKFFQHKTGLF